MTENPYAGTENESFWQSGYDEGIASPGGVPSPPDVLEEEGRTIWSEGALAGYQDGEREGFHVPINPGGNGGEHGENPVAVAGHMIETGHVVYEGYEVGKHLWEFGTAADAVASGEALGAAIGGGLFLGISTLVLLVALESPPSPPITDQTARGLASVAASSGRDELFVALCVNQEHSASGDAILAQGYWHGDLATSFTPAWQEAESHLNEHPDALGSVMVAHFSVAAPTQLELLTSE